MKPLRRSTMQLMDDSLYDQMDWIFLCVICLKLREKETLGIGLWDREFQSVRFSQAGLM